MLLPYLHPLIITLGIFVGVFLYWRAGRHELFESNILFDLLTIAFVGGLIFGRIFDFLLSANIYQWSITRLIFFNIYGSFNWWGALFGAIVSGQIYLKSQKIKISPNTILNYLSYLAASYFIYKVPRLDIVGKKIFEVIFFARGGQGAKTAAELLAQAALHEGKYIQAFPDFGPERTGAPMKTFVRVSDEPILTHEPVVANRTHRHVHIQDGQIIKEDKTPVRKREVRVK